VVLGRFVHRCLSIPLLEHRLLRARRNEGHRQRTERRTNALATDFLGPVVDDRKGSTSASSKRNLHEHKLLTSSPRLRPVRCDFEEFPTTLRPTKQRCRLHSVVPGSRLRLRMRSPSQAAGRPNDPHRHRSYRQHGRTKGTRRAEGSTRLRLTCLWSDFDWS
jgi:hypothetical protein